MAATLVCIATHLASFLRRSAVLIGRFFRENAELFYFISVSAFALLANSEPAAHIRTTISFDHLNRLFYEALVS